MNIPNQLNNPLLGTDTNKYLSGGAKSGATATAFCFVVLQADYGCFWVKK